MKKSRIFLLAIALIITFILVYTPHLVTPFPIHVDEWHHITEAIKLKTGDYTGGAIAYREGFHVFLAGLSYFVNLVEFWKFLPAIWAVVSGLVLFFVVYKKTENYPIALFSVLFFASIKSNVNIGGLWFFTPLTFSIPFIFLYVYFFTEGIEKRKKKFILIGLGIMLILIPIHVIGVLFAVPFLFIYLLFHRKFVFSEWKFFLLLLLIPLFGILFYSYVNHLFAFSTFSGIVSDLQFRKGWGVYEINNSPLEVYSLVGYTFAILGLAGVFLYSKKKYLAYALWPILVFLSIVYYRLFDVSYLVPYQRNIYYFALGLPFLSALGLYSLISWSRKGLNKINYLRMGKIILIVLVLIIFIFVFRSYYKLPEDVALYKVMDRQDYMALKFLADQPMGNVLAQAELSTAIYPVSGQEPVTTLNFYGEENRDDVDRFFSSTDCKAKNEIIAKHSVLYVVTDEQINCSWQIIYHDRDFIYSIR
jgi:hypothetical protein